MKYSLLFSLLLLPLPVFAESMEHPYEYDSEYVLSIDEHSYSIPYRADAKILAMAIDPELTSLLIGLEDAKESIFVIDLQHEMIDAENSEFAILVNGYDVDYEMVSDSDSSTFSFYIPEFTEEVEIIGTHVIPEFPFGVVLGFAFLVTAVTVFSRTKTAFKL
jgi:hypothetical protein